MARNTTLIINNHEQAIFTFEDADGHKLLVKPPKLGVFKRIKHFQKDRNNIDAGEMIDTLCELLADFLSNNKQGKVITKKYIEDTYSIEDAMKILNSFIEFLGGATSDPN